MNQSGAITLCLIRGFSDRHGDLLTAPMITFTEDKSGIAIQSDPMSMRIRRDLQLSIEDMVAHARWAYRNDRITEEFERWLRRQL